MSDIETHQRSGRSPRLRASLRLAGLLLTVFIVGVVVGRCDWGGDHEEHVVSHDGQWTCSMHPQIRSDQPGSCPICGMALIPVDQAVDPDRVVLSERAAILSRIRSEVVRKVPTSGLSRHLLGRIDYDETRLKTVTSWIDGRIEMLHVATTGQRLRMGQKVATVYSPEVYAAHADLIQAHKQVQRQGADPALAAAARAALEAARKRLALLGLAEEEIDQMQATDKPWRQVPVRATVTGTVIERLVDQGNYVQAGTGLYRVADLSRVWVQLDAYESDLSHLRVGQDVTIAVDALPGERFEGKVAFIDPVVGSQTRTSRVRVEVSNPDGHLRPGMFAEAAVSATSRHTEILAIADSAPLFTGRRSVVFVELTGTTDPTYELREVELGSRMGDRYPVLSGLTEGERVVTQGAFVLDADLQLRGGRSMMARADDAEREALQPIAIPDASRMALQPVLRSYLAIGDALSADDLARASAAASDLPARVAAVSGSLGPGDGARVFEPLARELERTAGELAKAGDLARGRAAFEAMSLAVLQLLQRFGNPLPETLQVAMCPMAMGNRGARWVQGEGELRNVYEGKDMLTCGSFESAVESGEHLGPADSLPAPAGPEHGGHP